MMNAPSLVCNSKATVNQQGPFVANLTLSENILEVTSFPREDVRIYISLFHSCRKKSDMKLIHYKLSFSGVGGLRWWNDLGDLKGKKFQDSAVSKGFLCSTS